MRLRSILSPVDFSDQSRQALRWAGAFAARFQSRLTVLSVVDPLLAETARIRFGQDLAKEETEPALRDFVAAAWPPGADAPAETVIETRIGDAAAVILETATDEAADLIVIGTQGLGGFTKWLLGSTTDRVLRRTRVPTLAVPPADNEPSTISRIVVAIDFSESSVGAISYAAELAERFSAALTLAHVVEPVSVPPQWRELVEEPEATRVADARARLEVLAAPYSGSRACETVVELGRPEDVIGSMAKACRAQLIVMGGPTAYRVASSSAMPVLVLPA